MPYNQLLKEDLNHIFINTVDLWSVFDNKSIFISGGTGFVGSWLLESLLYAIEEKKRNIKVTVLTRSHEIFKLKASNLANDPNLRFIEGDICNFKFPSGHFDYIIHAATDSSTGLDRTNPLLMFDTIVQGTRRMLDFAIHCGSPKFLFISSGAVYGKQPTNITHISEDFMGAPNSVDPRSTYSEGKRSAELLCSLYSKKFGIETMIARCFAFVGPYLPLNAHFAIGNFISDGLMGRPIIIKGDGTPLRSYLYAADLVIWLWTILLKGKSVFPYNVGSDEEIKIQSLAEITASSFKVKQDVIISAKSDINKQPERYIPSINRAQEELHLEQKIGLLESIRKTIAYQNAIILKE
jgi:nucleoside-diphosphate-sugar epimerase